MQFALWQALSALAREVEIVCAVRQRHPGDDEAVKRELAQWVPEYRPALDAPPARAAS